MSLFVLETIGLEFGWIPTEPGLVGIPGSFLIRTDLPQESAPLQLLSGFD